MSAPPDSNDPGNFAATSPRFKSQSSSTAILVRQTVNNLVLGVDIGGTKVAAGIVDSAGEILRKVRTRMVARGAAEEGLQAVFDAIDGVFRGRGARNVRAIGVSAPGWVDSKRGVITGATNVPCWRNFPLVSQIKRRHKLPTKIANDANAGALAETAWGAAAGYSNVFYASLGTGVGAGLVLDGKIYGGRTGAAVEGGHVTIDFNGPRCDCGKRGCIEVYASGGAIARRARELLSGRGGYRSRMAAMAGGPKAQRMGRVTAEIVSKAARAGDKLAVRILEEAADRLAIWLGNTIDLLEPDIIVVGGGVGKVMASYLPRIRKQLAIWAINPEWRKIPIVGARYGSESALVGAAALCFPAMRYRNLRISSVCRPER